MGVSITVTLVALVLWGWILGPLGAVLAIPMTLLCKALLVDADPRATWVNAIIGSGRPPRPAPALRLPRRRSRTASETPEAAKPPNKAGESGVPGTPQAGQN